MIEILKNFAIGLVALCATGFIIFACMVIFAYNPFIPLLIVTPFLLILIGAKIRGLY